MTRVGPVHFDTMHSSLTNKGGRKRPLKVLIRPRIAPLERMIRKDAKR